MILLLDTNVCIDLMRKSHSPVSDAFLAAIAAGHDLVISSITTFELELGVLRAGNKAKDVGALADFRRAPGHIVNFDTDCAKSAATLCDCALSQGRQLSAYDGLIAGHALSRGATLVTSDARLAAAVTEFGVVNWR